MTIHYYILAAVAAAALMAIEHRVLRSQHRSDYAFDRTIASSSNFAFELVLTVLLHLDVFAGYELLSRRVALLHPSASSPLTWVAAFLAIDFLYYWGHRVCHRIPVMWALHTVHHQSGDYNLGIGLRGPWLSALQIAPFVLPLALVGFPPAVLFPIYAAHTVWKLVVHTRVVGKLGPIEGTLITPSAHRVHHGRNARYIDRNFGGVLAIWDRIFGTYQAEDEAVIFADERGLSTDAVRNNLAPWRDLARAALRAPGKLGWARVLFWEHATKESDAAESRRPIARPSKVALGVAFLATAAVTLAFAARGASLSPIAKWSVGAVLFFAMALVNRRLTRPAGVLDRSA